MLAAVVGLNILIAGLCWYGAWRVWRVRAALAKITEALALAELNVQALQSAPESIRKGQISTQQLRQQYQTALFWLRQVQQLSVLLSLGQVVGQRWVRQARAGQRQLRFTRQSREISVLSTPLPTPLPTPAAAR